MNINLDMNNLMIICEAKRIKHALHQLRLAFSTFDNEQDVLYGRIVHY